MRNRKCARPSMQLAANRSCAVILALVALSAFGCASAPTSPPDWLPDPADVGKSELGGWVEVECSTPRGRTVVDGELLAIDNGRVYVLRGDGIRTVPIDSVRSARLTWYDSHGGSVAGLAALGALSTLGNGALLIFTAPMWMIGGTVAAHSQYHAPLVEEWERMRLYARFPQGLPPGFVPSAPVVAQPITKPVVEPETPSPAPLPSRQPTEGGTHWGFAAGGGAAQYPGSQDSGLGFVLGLNVGSKWTTAGLRMAVADRDEITTAYGSLEKTTMFDLGLLFGARVGFGPFELAARAGPAAWGFSIDDFLDVQASFAAQGELFVYPWHNVGIGTVVAYNNNDALDFYVVTIGIAVGPR